MSDCERDEKWERIDALDKIVNDRTEWTDYFINGTNDIQKEIFEFGMEIRVIQLKDVTEEDFPMFVEYLDGLLAKSWALDTWAIYVPAPINFILSAFHNTEDEALDKMTDYYKGTKLLDL